MVTNEVRLPLSPAVSLVSYAGNLGMNSGPAQSVYQLDTSGLRQLPVKPRPLTPGQSIKLPDGGDAILVEGQPPYPAPFLDLRAGRTNETWEPIGVTVDDTAGVGPPEQRLREQDMDLLHAEVLFPNMQVGPRLWRAIKDEDVYRATVRAYNDWLGEEYCPVSRDRLIGLGVIPWTNVDDAIAVVRWLIETPAVSGIFNVGTGVARSFRDLMTAMFAALGRPPAIEYVDMPVSIRDSYQYVTEARTENLRRAGYNADFMPLEAAVQRYVSGYLDRADRYR